MRPSPYRRTIECTCEGRSYKYLVTHVQEAAVSDSPQRKPSRQCARTTFDGTNLVNEVAPRCRNRIRPTKQGIQSFQKHVFVFFCNTQSTTKVYKCAQKQQYSISIAVITKALWVCVNLYACVFVCRRWAVRSDTQWLKHPIMERYMPQYATYLEKNISYLLRKCSSPLSMPIRLHERITAYHHML